VIVISGALVLVALVLLIIGVVGPDLAFVYASIAVSLVSLVFLVVGILQRRGEPATAAEGVDAPQPVTVDDPAEGVTVRPTSVRRAAAPVVEDDVEPLSADEAPVAGTVDEEPVPGGDVLVVEGRPRYHVVGCRYLSGKTPEAVEVGQARAEGFTPCGVCKPDVALVALAEEEAALEPSTEELLLDLPTDEVEEAGPAPVVEQDVPGVGVAPAARRTATRTVARTTPAKAAPAPAAPAKTVRSTARANTPVAPAAAPRRTSATRATSAPVAAAPARSVAPRGGSVVVIPDRGRYHRDSCRYVRDVAGAEVLSKSAATRQGYAPCGVCKP